MRSVPLVSVLLRNGAIWGWFPCDPWQSDLNSFVSLGVSHIESLIAEDDNDNMTVIPPDERPIDLVRGWPSTTLLPTNAVSEAAQKVLANPSIAFPGLEYGPDEGHLPLREAIAAWNNNFYDPGYAINKKRITITGGASQNLGCILSVFTDPTYTRNIWIVAPAYMLAFRVFQDAGFASKLRAVPEDEKGIDLAFLRRELIDSEKAAQAQRNNRPVRHVYDFGRRTLS